MGILQDAGVSHVFHYAPLHYLPFIARSRKLLSKPALRQQGFQANHLRSTSSNTDIERGFGTYVHLTLASSPPILLAKLASGFPHVRLVIPVKAVDDTEFSLCRYNVAKCRFLRRGGKSGFPESPTNGRYYPGHEIPVARDPTDQAAMLAMHLPLETMIEVLTVDTFPLPDVLQVDAFSNADAELAKHVIAETKSSWNVRATQSLEPYTGNGSYTKAVTEFVDRALGDPNWRGNGLEFDRV